MKKTLLFVVFATVCLLSNAQFITNNGFETWTGSDPANWTSPNSLTSGFGVTTVTKETVDVYAGLNSAKLVTTPVLGTPVPGILTNGTITLSAPYVNGGVPFTDRPASFKGYYKYTPAGGDFCFMSAALFKTGASDTIGYAQFTNLATVGAYTLFQADFTYSLPDNPDTIQIIISSSNPNAAVNGSVLKVDALYLEGGTLGISKYHLLNNISIFPNPVNDNLIVNYSFESKSNASIKIINSLGISVYETDNISAGNNNSININTSNLTPGIYFLTILSGNKTETRKFVVVR